MALYRYVDDRDGLERLVVDLVLGQLDLKPPKHLAWRRQVIALLERVRATVGAHPAITPLTLTHRHRCEGVKRIGEAVLGVLAEAGLPPKQRVIAFRTLLSFLIGALQGEYLAPLTGAGTMTLAAATADYPILAETARHARAITPAQEFKGGLELILNGMSSTASGGEVDDPLRGGDQGTIGEPAVGQHQRPRSGSDGG